MALRPNEPFKKDDIQLPFATPVPLEETTTSHEYYRIPVESLSTKLPGDASADSGILIFIHNTGQESDIPLPVETVRSWSFLNSKSRPIPDFFEQIQIDSRHGWLGLSRRLSAGCYVIESAEANRTIQQAVWLSSGWITGLFISNTRQGPALDFASIQMRRLERLVGVGIRKPRGRTRCRVGNGRA